jgi:hypothetical protein
MNMCPRTHLTLFSNKHEHTTVDWLGRAVLLILGDNGFGLEKKREIAPFLPFINKNEEKQTASASNPHRSCLKMAA